MVFGLKISHKIRQLGWSLAFLSLFLMETGCAYHFGYGRRSLPGGYKRLAVPLFENNTDEVGAEVYFTNAIINEFHRSQVAEITKADEAAVTMEGVISNVRYLHSAQTEANASNFLPEGTALTTEYRVLLTAQIVLRRNSDQKVIWRGSFSNERVYPAPQIGSASINSANATYNHSARYQNIAQLAEYMMEEAHDRMTENF